MELNFKTLGQGEPVIILHGLFGMLDNWQTIGKQLAEHHTVYLVDQRNHGRSPHLPDFDYSLLAEDLRQFMEAQWIHRAHIVGHSMGGKTAMQFALDNPDMVDKLVVVDIAPIAYKGGHQKIFEALFSVDLDHLEDRKQATQKLSEKIDEPGVRQFLLKNLSRKKEGGYRWKMNLESLYKNYQQILGPLEAYAPYEDPVLFIRGAQSNYIEDATKEDIEALFPAYQLETIPDAGHWVHADSPKALLSLLTNYLG